MYLSFRAEQVRKLESTIKVLLSASSTVLGNVEIGRNAKIAAGSVVLENVREGATVAGVPAKEVRQDVSNVPADNIDHLIE